MLFTLNFVKVMGYFCNKVFAAFKQVRYSLAFLYPIAGILLLLSTTICFGISQYSVLTDPKTYVVLSNGICFTLCQ